MAEESASIVDIVGFGLQLGTTLQSYVETSRDAKDGLVDVASDINATASTLKQLHDLLHADDVETSQMQVFKPEGRQEIMAMTTQCQNLYTTIIVLLTKAGSASVKGKAKDNVTFASVGNSILQVSSLTRDLNWDWLGRRIERCQGQLGWLKMSLLLNLQLASLARFQIRTTQRIPGSFEEELGMRALAERLRRKKVKSTKVLLDRQRRSEISSSLSSASSVIIIKESPFIDIGDGSQNLPPPHSDTFRDMARDIRPVGLVYGDHVGPKSQNDRAADEQSESSVTLNNFEEDSKKGDMSVKSVSTATAKVLDESKTPKPKEDSKEIEVFKSLPLYESKLRSWVRRMFEPRDKWLGDWQSEDLEGYVIMRDSTIFKLPLGHKALSARVKAMRKKSDASFWSTFLTAHPRFYQILTYMLNESMKTDGRERTCAAFEVFTTDKSLREPAPHDQLLVIFSLEKPADLVLLEDCVGRKMVIPFHLCATWGDMHELISQTFKYVAVTGPHVECGHYDLLTLNDEHIVPQTWKSQVKPGLSIKMKLWPMPKESYAYIPSGEPTESGIPDDLTVYKRSPQASTTMRRSIENTKASALLAAEQAKSTPIPMLRLKDAVGRIYSFPFEKCRTRDQIGELITDAFLHVEVIGPHVLAGHYDLISPAGNIILAAVWDKTVQPGWLVSMQMWPMPSATPIQPSPHIFRPIAPYHPPSTRTGPPPPPGWISPLPRPTPRASPAPPPSFIRRRRRNSCSSSSTSTSLSSLVEDEDIVSEEGDLGIQIDLEREESENEMGLGELLRRWTNAIDCELETSMSDSADGSSTCSSLSDD